MTPPTPRAAADQSARSAAAPHPGLWEALLSRTGRGTLHAWQDTAFTHTPWRDVVAEAHTMAAALRSAGVGPGTRVGAVLTNTPEAVRGLLAVWIAGGTVASLPLPARGMTSAEYGDQLRTLAGQLDPGLLVLTPETALPAPPDLTGALPVTDWATLAAQSVTTGGHRVEPCPPGLDDIAFIQYSSGSTSTPKGCALTPRAIAAQLGMMLDFAGSAPGRETIGCWLPLSHDMGVFGCLLNAWAYDFDLVLSTPERFAMAPRSWFRDLSEYGATMTAGTSTALHLATRAQSRTAALPRELTLRVLVLGAERVDWHTLDQARRRFAPSGLRPEAFMPAYGLAEATLAAAATPWFREPVVRYFDGAALLDGEAAETTPDAPRAVPLVSNGPPLPGVNLTPTRSGRVEEITLTSPSLAAGYYGDPRRTADRFPGGRFHTGDRGFLHQGDLYLTGRTDDMLSVGGRKIYATEIEAALDGLGTLRHGSSVLLETTGTGPPRLVLLTEIRRRTDDFHRVAGQAAAVAAAKSGVALAECRFLDRGALPRTPSGKIQRSRSRALLNQDRLRTVARVPFD
ncbi:AMP-binding protein [Streptomyces sp. JJ66]|uniref:AMP-binding protein n=1 Tax=Streptomyces sp. JJ66 TaxID=2803843 RepID=UPI001C5672AD|nr:AMP-binding protein [Streptomyces sp. JJ66]MBW1602234.1 AMP-binding protein [Streptomyces sp. JJ66]